MYNINFKDIVYQAVGWFLRTPNFLKILYSAIKPLQELNNNFKVIQSFGELERVNPSRTALDYDATITYIIGDYRKYLSVTYKCNTVITVPESFTASKWDRISNVNISMYQFKLFISNFLNFDARTIYLEKYLNDIYDPVTEGINIVNDNTIHVLYLFNEAEQADPVYFYNNWDSTVAYIASPEDYAVSGNKVYECILNNTNKLPYVGSIYWDYVEDIIFMFNYQDEYPYDYTVEVPTNVTLQPDYSNDRIKSQINLFNAAGRSYIGVEKGVVPIEILFTKN